jgi:tetratricopeptide (TPR) repeat protein
MRSALLLLFLFFGLNQSLFAQQDSLAEQMQRAKENLYKQPQLAKAQLEELLVNARSKGNLNIQFEASKQLSFINSNSGNFDAAKAYLIDATAIADANNRADQKAELSYLLGTLFHAQGDLSQALQKYLEALRYYEQVNHLYGKLNTYLMLADLYSRQNNFSRAIDYNLKALTLFQQKNDKFRQLNIYEQVGSMYERQNMLNKAIEYYTQALKVYREIDNHTGEAAALINLARIQLAQGTLANSTLRGTQLNWHGQSKHPHQRIRSGKFAIQKSHCPSQKSRHENRTRRGIRGPIRSLQRPQRSRHLKSL